MRMGAAGVGVGAAGGNGNCWMGMGAAGWEWELLCSSSCQDSQRFHGGLLAASLCPVFPLPKPVVAEVPRGGSEVFLGRAGSLVPFLTRSWQV